MPASWVGIGELALGAYSAYSASQNKGGGSSGGQAAQTSNAASENAAKISADQWDYYKSNYQPLETDLIGKASTAGSPEEFARNRGAANADVTGAFDNTRKQTLSRMQSYGINPGSPAFQDAAASTDIAEGATKAGALTAADTNTRALAYSKALDVVGLGRNIPAQSAASSANAANSAAGLSKIRFDQNQQNMRNTGYGLNTLGNTASKWFGSNNTNTNANYTSDSTGNQVIGSPTSYGDTYSTTDPAYGASGGKVSRHGIRYADGGVIDAERTGPGSYDATRLKGVLRRHGLNDVNAHNIAHRISGRRAGVEVITPHMRTFSAGGGVGRSGTEGPDASSMGELQGPGTGTSDSIPAIIDGQRPAALSTGEVVVNSDAAKLSGDEILAAINEAGLRKRQRYGIEAKP